MYNELLEYLLNNVPTTISAGKVESFLYKIFHAIQDADTLNPTWITEAVDHPLSCYLASRGVIVLENHRISFFHQSFYDYVLARYYVSKKKSFINELPYQFQGLEIRSTVKLLLDFERASSDKMYRKDLEIIIFSDRIRSHIKQLALSVVAYSDDIRGFEKKIVRRLYEYDYHLFAFFISSAISDDQWFYTIEELIKPLLPEMILKSKMYSSIANFLCNKAPAHADSVYGLIDKIKDEDTKLRLVAWIMHCHNDYLSENVRAWYFKIKETNNSDLVSYIHDAIKTNLNFALQETENLLYDYLVSDNKTQKKHNDYMLIEQLCKYLYDNHPKEFLPLLHRCFTKITNEKRLPSSCWNYFRNSVFEPCQYGYVESIYEWLGNLLEQYVIEDPLFVKTLVAELLNVNDEMSLALGFRTMGANVHIFAKNIWQILSDDSIIDKYLEPGKFEYYFLNMLKNWYYTLDTENAIKYQSILLTFKSESDGLFNKDRSYSNLIYSHLWWRKFILICSTLSSEALIPSLRKCKQELLRRFGYEYENKKPNHQIAFAKICGGIVSDEQYKRFSIKTWRNAFRLKRSNTANGKCRPFDVRVQAKVFMSCVEERPEYFKNFIFEIFEDNQTQYLYKVNGLLGLLSSGCDIIELIPLFKQFLNIEYIQSNSYDFEQMAKYYTKKENIVLNEMIPILAEVINKPFKPQKLNVDSSCDQLERRVNNMLTDAINSPQGIVLHILIEIFLVSARRTQIGQLLMSLQAGLSEELKLQVIRVISSKECYDEELFDNLYPILISNMDSSALLINTNAIQFYYYTTNRPFINEYINKIMSDVNCHVFLSQIFFYGTARQDEVANKCSVNLEKVLSNNDESVIAKMVELSIKCLSNIDLSNLSKKILIRYRNDDRKDVIHSYQLFCHEMPVECFDLFLELSENWKTEKHFELHGQLEYIEKCINKYPIKCYKYISKNNYWLSGEGYYFEDNVVKVLLKIYKKLKNDEDAESMNKIMNAFDKLLLINSRVVNNALEKMEIS